MTLGSRLLGIAVIGGLLLAGLAYPLVGGLGHLAGQAIGGAEATTPGVLTGQMPSVTTITDDAGAPIAYLYDQDRQVVASDRISTAMKAAIVAIEDRRFFGESGLDARGVLRALVNNSSGGATQGASTLTEQYVKNYDEYVAARTPAQQLRATAPDLGRKVREAEVAEQLDHGVPKDQILTWYLNVVSFGNQAFGVQAAARTYFDTTADRLTVPQAALLAGMVQSPAQDDPVRHPAAATARRNLVIDQMAQQGDITLAQAAEATAAPLGVDPALHGVTEGCLGAGDAGFFCSYVLDDLARSGISADELRRGGYTVHTTMNRAATEQAKAAVDAEVPPTQPHVADVLSVVSPGADAHRVTAMVANRSYGLDASQQQTTYDLPGAPENLGAGSVYKIFTSSAYLAQGGGIDTVIPVPAERLRVAADPGLRRVQRRRLPAADDPAGRPRAVAEHRLRQARGDHRDRAGGRHGGAAGDCARSRSRRGPDSRRSPTRSRRRTRRRSPSASRRPARSSSPTSARRSRATASGARPALSRR